MADLNQGTLTGKVSFVYQNLDGARSNLKLILSVDDSYKDKDGVWQKRYVSVPMTAFGNYASYLADQVAKGDVVVVNFKLSSQQKEDADGKKTTILYANIDSLVNMSKRLGAAGEPESAPAQPAAKGGKKTATQADGEDKLEDFPF